MTTRIWVFFVTAVQNQHTWFINGDFSSAIETFLSESAAYVTPVPSLNVSTSTINAACPIIVDAYCGYGINIKLLQDENMTDIIAFFGRYSAQNIVSISTTTYYSGLANFAQSETVIEPNYVQGSVFKYLDNSRQIGIEFYMLCIPLTIYMQQMTILDQGHKQT